MTNELSQSEEQLRSLISSLDDFVFSLDLDGKILFYQPVQWSIYDTPAVTSAYVGAAYQDVLPPEVSAVIPGVIAEVNRTLSPYPIEYTLTADDGVHYYKGRIAPMFSPQYTLIGYTFVVSDVTQAVLAKMRDDRLLALEGLHREIGAIFFERTDPAAAVDLVLAKIGEMLRVSSVYVCHFRENERRLDMTHEWCAAGISAKRAETQNFAFDEHMPSLVQLLTRDGIVAAKDISQLPSDMQSVLNGQSLHSLLLLPFRVNERLEGFLGLEETHYQRDWLPEETAALRTAADGYARLIERQRAERDLITARDTAIRSAQHKSEFVAKMSHEVRTPMTIMLGMMELIEETPLSDEQRDLLTMAQENAHRLMNMLVEVLDFSELERGTVSLQAIPVDVRGVLAEIETMWADAAHRKGLDFAISVDEQVPQRIVSDPARLRQVISILTNNAVKFTEAGSVRIAVWPMPSRYGESRLRFQVSDTGIGIPPDKQQLIFESFMQADNSLTRRHEGAGVGLAIYKQLVDLMEGEIDVQSAEGAGSTFSFAATFPLA
ncbi:MAG: hypothetical protein IPO91_32225 [Chloroflexi bacterium]|nr:hypothetical protein [Chloroflexota bacterium]